MSLFSEDAVPLSRKLLQEQYADDQIYRKFYPEFELGTVRSPFHADENPSFSFHDKSNEGHILWHDHTKRLKGDVFDFIQQYFKFRHGKVMTMGEVLQLVSDTMKGEAKQGSDVRVITDQQMPSPVKGKRSETIFTVVVPPGMYMPDFAMNYWDKRGFSENLLKLYRTGFADEVWITKVVNGEKKITMWGKSSYEDPIFFWEFTKGHYKFYRPLCKDPKRKWISNISKKLIGDIQGYDQCRITERFPPLIILTKSMKDIMHFRMFGIDAMAMHGEGHDPGQPFIDHLRSYCTILVSLYDNDRPGMRAAVGLRHKYGIPDLYYLRKDGKDTDEVYMNDYKTFYNYVNAGKEAINYLYEYSERLTVMDPRFAGHLYPGEVGRSIRR
jgi:hypothetical protein